MSIQKIGFVGCGRMGGGMAANLLKAGFELAVYDKNPETLPPLVELGARRAESPADACAGADVAMMMLHNPVVDEVMMGEEGVVPALGSGTIVVDSGNGDPRLSRKRFETCRDRGLQFLDAGVSGGRSGAMAGTLAIMVGGERRAFDRAIAIFQAMGKSVVYMGGPGSGHLAKVVNNLVVHGSWFLIGEALAFAERQGLDMPALMKAMSTGAARSFIMDNAVQAVLEPPAEGWRSDLDNLGKARGGSYQESWALEMADEIGHPLPMVALINELTKMYQANGDRPNATMVDKIHHRVMAAAEPAANS